MSERKRDEWGSIIRNKRNLSIFRTTGSTAEVCRYAQNRPSDCIWSWGNMYAHSWREMCRTRRNTRHQWNLQTTQKQSIQTDCRDFRCWNQCFSWYPWLQERRDRLLRQARYSKIRPAVTSERVWSKLFQTKSKAFLYRCKGVLSWKVSSHSCSLLCQVVGWQRTSSSILHTGQSEHLIVIICNIS